MAGTREKMRFWGVALTAGLLLAAGQGREGRADRIVLRGGGQVRGKVLPDPAHPERVTVLPEKGRTTLTFDKPRVLEIVREPSALDDYVVKRDKVGASAESQYELGLWCAEHKLSDLARKHYEEAVRYDKSFGPAHQKLGHVLYAGRWLTTDELREAQGLVKYKGKWITKEEKEQREERAAATAEQAGWVRRLGVLRQAVIFGTEERRRDAETQLRAIRDPLAVTPLVYVFGEDVPPLRTLLDSLLGSIPGPEAGRALVARLLYEMDDEVRKVTMEQVGLRPERDVSTQLVRALRSTNPAVVNRAAWALGNLHVVEAVPKLVGALFTTQYRVVMTSGGGSGGGGVRFGSVSPMASQGSLMAYNGSSAAYLIPPVMGQNAVAFGATSGPLISGPSLSIGGAPSGNRGSIPRLMPFTYRNVEVLNALIKLTGQDFGFDVDTWKRWVKTSFQPNPTPARRVPQP